MSIKQFNNPTQKALDEPKPEFDGASAMLDIYKLSCIFVWFIHSLIIGFFISLTFFTFSVIE